MHLSFQTLLDAIVISNIVICDFHQKHCQKGESFKTSLYAIVITKIARCDCYFKHSNVAICDCYIKHCYKRLSFQTFLDEIVISNIARCYRHLKHYEVRLSLNILLNAIVTPRDCQIAFLIQTILDAVVSPSFQDTIFLLLLQIFLDMIL